MTEWFVRPVLNVTEIRASLQFYIEKLGFLSPWHNEEEGVVQVDRQGCSLILADTWAAKAGKGVIFISLNVEAATPGAATAALDELRAEFERRGVVVNQSWWGYRLLVVEDPDGNQLLFNYPNETHGDS